ncbi:MAG: hypothetical protein ACRELF_21165 [Gemmataceae bacterium]
MRSIVARLEVNLNVVVDDALKLTYCEAGSQDQNVIGADRDDGRFGHSQS